MLGNDVKKDNDDDISQNILRDLQGLPPLVCAKLARVASNGGYFIEVAESAPVKSQETAMIFDVNAKFYFSCAEAVERNKGKIIVRWKKTAVSP